MTNDETLPAALGGGEDETADTQPVAAAPSGEVLQVRHGGQAGVRVKVQGEVTHKRVSASAVDQQADYRQVPIAVLAEVRALLEGEQQLSPGEARVAVRDLLAPWFPA